MSSCSLIRHLSVLILWIFLRIFSWFTFWFSFVNSNLGYYANIYGCIFVEYYSYNRSLKIAGSPWTASIRTKTILSSIPGSMTTVRLIHLTSQCFKKTFLNYNYEYATYNTIHIMQDLICLAMNLATSVERQRLTLGLLETWRLKRWFDFFTICDRPNTGCDIRRKRWSANPFTHRRTNCPRIVTIFV